MSGQWVTQFTNCRILKEHQLIKEDVWVRGGKIIDPGPLFFGDRKNADQKIDCGGNILAPGFIDLQINGAFGVDFSYDVVDEESGAEVVGKVGKGILAHGVTSYCPTVVTSPPEVYHKVLPNIPRKQGGVHGATVLGVHVEGPFINKKKKGAHPEQHILAPETGMRAVEAMYGPGFVNVAMITLGPELAGAMEVVEGCVERGVCVSLGHTMAELSQGEEAVRRGARMVTHLFNAMQSFHHRDPGLVGLLTSEKLEGKRAWYGIIADGVHAHPAALRIAYKTNFENLVLVTDAILAMGFKDGRYRFGQQEIEVRGDKAYVADTDTLTGSVATMQSSITKFIKHSRCSIVEALEAASLHPAQAMGIEHKKGTLEYGSDADFVILNPQDLSVQSTWIEGQCVFTIDGKTSTSSSQVAAMNTVHDSKHPTNTLETPFKQPVNNLESALKHR